MHLVVRQAELLASDGSPWAWCFLGEVIQCLSPWLNYLLETRWERLQWSAETDRRVCSIFSKLAGEKALATWLCLLGGRRLGELQLIISVQDPERSGMIADESRRCNFQKEVSCLYWRLTWSTSVTGHMRYMAWWKLSTVAYPCRRTPEKHVGHLRLGNITLAVGTSIMYSLENVIRSAHVIPTSAEHESFYVNNYIDWDQYNTLYDPDFLRNGKRLAKQLARQLDTEMRNEGTWIEGDLEK